MLLVLILLMLSVGMLSGGMPNILAQVLAVLACGLAVAILLIAQLSWRRQQHLITEVARLLDSGEAPQLRLQGGDEFADLARYFNKLNTILRSGAEHAQSLEMELYLVQSCLEQRIHERTSELAVARDQALESSRIKSAFLANMSHELRTPLNAIIGYCEILEDEVDEGGEGQIGSDLKKIKSAGSHLLSVISDILDLSKIEAGKMQVELERFKVAHLVQDVVSSVVPLIEKNANRFSLEIDADVEEMVSDPVKLRQSLINLLGNAAKFTQNGFITLSVSYDDPNNEWICFSVRDTGIGISSEEIHELFVEFSQLDNSSTRKYGGTGLGLTISKRYTEMLGGHIKVDSQSDKGTVFTIKLPTMVKLNEPSVSNEISKVSPVVRIKTDRRNYVSTVLIIDADPNALLFLPEYLQKAGFNISTAETAKRGLHLARRVNPDVILLDVMLADSDGWSCLLELKADAELKRIPVIILSKTDEKTKAYDMGAQFCLQKPVKELDLTQAIKRCVRKQVAEAQNARPGA